MTARVVAAFVPLVDAAVLVAAREQGFAAEQGLELTLVKEPSWASLRDHLLLGHVDCAHALAPLPIAATLGVGHVKVDCIVPFVLSRGGNAVTVSRSLYAEMEQRAGARGLTEPAAAAAALAAAARSRLKALTLGMVFPFSGHNFDLRHWLAAGGLHPDRDVRLVAIPPPLMVESLRAGHVDGFCVGEPWNSLAVREGLGCIVATKAELFPHGVEKVLAVRAALEGRMELLAPLLRALDRAGAWADDAANHETLAALLARPEYLNVPAELVAAALAGRIALGTGRTVRDPDFVYFHRHAANVPSAADAVLIYAQMARWGQLEIDARGEKRAARVFRADLYRQYVGSTAAVPPLPAFDGTALGGGAAAYLQQFEIHTPFAGAATAREL